MKRSPIGPVCVLLLALAPQAAGAEGRDVRELELVSEVFGNTRTIRVLLPPSYDERLEARYPVFYFTDGVAAFAEGGWNVPGVARGLWAGGRIREMIFVGIDNGGSTRESENPVRDRASEYLPYEDPTWTGADRPQPRGDRFPSFLFDEVMPLVDRMFRTETGAAGTGLAGDSYAGLATLYTALRHPDRLGWLLVESPSLHVGDGRLLDEARRSDGWPRAVYLGVGTAEGEDERTRRRVVDDVRTLYEIIGERAPSVRLELTLREGASHWYDAWRERLPEALVFLVPAGESGRQTRSGRSDGPPVATVSSSGPSRRHQPR